MQLIRNMACSVGLGLFVATLGATAAPQPHSGTSSTHITTMPMSVDIPCELSPFGEAAPVIRDLEPVLLHYGLDNTFSYFNPSEGSASAPLQAVYNGDLFPPGDSQISLRKSVNADLNGDGRDEVVAIFSDGANVRVAVYSRTLAGVTPHVIDTWNYSESVDTVTIDGAAGNFDGSKDRQQEIALSWNISTGPDTGKTRVSVLKGDATAHIAQADNSAAGTWVLPFQDMQFPRLAVGDFLLDGREQMVLAAVVPGLNVFGLTLIEFDDGSHPDSVTEVLPPRGLAMRADWYNNLLGLSEGPFTFDLDGDVQLPLTEDGNGEIVVTAFDVDAGDLVDTAADELVLHVMFPEPVNPLSNVLAQRVAHFITTRDANNNITAIELGNTGGLADSSILLERYPSSNGNTYPPKFDATVADVDGIKGAEIITAEAGHDGSSPTSGPLVWFAHKASVRSEASFQFRNQGLDGGTNEPLVAFINHSHGDITSYDWDFGDGTPQSHLRSPVHRYNTTGNYTVSLHITAADGTQSEHGYPVIVTGVTDTNPQGIPPLPLRYRIDPTPAFSASTASEYQYPTYGSDHTIVRLAVGDLNRDSLPEVVIAASANIAPGFTHVHVYKRKADGSFERASFEEAAHGNTSLGLLLSDFDGNSLHAVLNDGAGDCRRTADRSMRSLTWMPPYFSMLQADSNRSARYGMSSSNSTSVEERSASYTSHDITGTIGVGYELSAPILAVKLAEVEVKVSVGHTFQSETGELHGDEVEYTRDQGFSLDDDQSTDQEGLLTTEQTAAECYSYKLATSAGNVQGSGMRMCETKPVLRVQTAPGATDWNWLATASAPYQAPYDWVPAQRDWASLAMFRAPTAGAAGGTVAFIDGSSVDKATDGLFTTAAESNGNSDRPYLEIDLGSVREIDSVRVFPKITSTAAFEPVDFKDSVKDLAGFRLYVSATPFANNAAPTTATSTTVLQDGISTFVQEMNNEQSKRIWNVWTGSPLTGTPLFGRYLRLQQRGQGKIAIAEIQVFGDTHSEPPSFPDAVCDDRVGDGLFKATVYDKIHQVATTIELRGDMLWTGAVDYIGDVPQESGVPGCSNDFADGGGDSLSPGTVRKEPIWQGVGIGDAGSADWTLSENQVKTQADDEKIDGITHLGAEFEAKFGPGVQVIVGASYEVGFGATTEKQTSTAHGKGFTVSGVIGGFNNQQVADLCRYFPRPYAFKVTNYSNTGFRHDTYVTDYVVRQSNRANAWQRDAVPTQCHISDRIFANDFE